MKPSDRNILLICAGAFIVIVGALWYLTHRPDTYSSTDSSLQPIKPKSLSSTGELNPFAPRSNGTLGTPEVSSKPVVTPHIFVIQPSTASAGTQVVIMGEHFTAAGNLITFGTSAGLHRPDGTPDNQVASLQSTGGTSIRFTIPTSNPSGVLCDGGNKCSTITAGALPQGTYPVTLHNKNGTSNTVQFTVTH